MTVLNKAQSLVLISQDSGAWGFKDYLKSKKIVIDNADVAKEALKKDGMLLDFCCEDFKNNYDLAMIAVINNGMALDYVSEDLKDNDSIVKIAMKLNQAIVFASPRIKKDKEFALLSISYNPSDIRFYSKEIQDIYNKGGIPGLSRGQRRTMQRENLEKAINSEKLANQLDSQLSPTQSVPKRKI